MHTYAFEVENKGPVNDGFHLFDGLYHHRIIFFSVIYDNNKQIGWKSRKHHDVSMYDDYFIVGVTIKEGDYTYHYHKPLPQTITTKIIGTI